MALGHYPRGVLSTTEISGLDREVNPQGESGTCIPALTPIRNFERHAWLPSRRLCMLKMDSFRRVMPAHFFRIGAYARGVLSFDLEALDGWYGVNTHTSHWTLKTKTVASSV